MEKTGRSLWELLIITRDAIKPIQLTCEECFALLEYDADLLTAGVGFETIRNLIGRHLVSCQKCRLEFDAWLKKLDDISCHPDSR